MNTYLIKREQHGPKIYVCAEHGLAESAGMRPGHKFTHPFPNRLVVFAVAMLKQSFVVEVLLHHHIVANHIARLVQRK